MVHQGNTQDSHSPPDSHTALAISMTEKKLNNFLNQAKLIMSHNQEGKNKLPTSTINGRQVKKNYSIDQDNYQ
jgi:phage antirepressor YoqD-like protein